MSERIRPRTLLTVVLTASAFTLLATSVLTKRSIWYDEAITLAVSSGVAAPTWPSEPTDARELYHRFLTGPASLRRIADEVERHDVHPPGYYWLISLWRAGFGSSLEAVRAFSLVCTLGTVLLLFSLLQTAGYDRPLVPTAVYALTASAIFFGQEARAYGLATTLVTAGAFLAYVGSELTKGRRKSVLSVAASGTLLGAAFHVNYLTLFPSCATLLWLWARGRGRSPSRVVWAGGAYGALVALGVPLLVEQAGRGVSHFVGFRGLSTELPALLFQNLLVFWTPREGTLLPVRVVFLAVLISVVWSIVRIWRERSSAELPLWALLAGLLVAPSLGILGVDIVLDRHMHAPRYFAAAGPAAAVFVAHGWTALPGRRGIASAAVIGASLFVLAIPWLRPVDEPLLGAYPHHRERAWLEPAARADDLVVAVGGGFGTGTPSAVVYELGSRDATAAVEVLVIEPEGIRPMLPRIEQHREVWIVPSLDGVTAKEEDGLAARLASHPAYRRRPDVGAVRRFARFAPSDAEDAAGPTRRP